MMSLCTRARMHIHTHKCIYLYTMFLENLYIYITFKPPIIAHHTSVNSVTKFIISYIPWYTVCGKIWSGKIGKFGKSKAIHQFFTRQLFLFIIYNISCIYTCSSVANILPFNYFRLACLPIFYSSKIFPCTIHKLFIWHWMQLEMFHNRA